MTKDMDALTAARQVEAMRAVVEAARWFEMQLGRSYGNIVLCAGPKHDRYASEAHERLMAALAALPLEPDEPEEPCDLCDGTGAAVHGRRAMAGFWRRADRVPDTALPSWMPAQGRHPMTADTARLPESPPDEWINAMATAIREEQSRATASDYPTPWADVVLAHEAYAALRRAMEATDA